MERFRLSERETRTINTYGEALLGSFLCSKDVAALWAVLAWLHARLVAPFARLRPALTLRSITSAASAVAWSIAGVFALSVALLLTVTDR